MQMQPETAEILVCELLTAKPPRGERGEEQGFVREGCNILRWTGEEVVLLTYIGHCSLSNDWAEVVELVRKRLV